jgi:transposase
VRKDQRRAERYGRYTQVQRLKAAGVSHREMARRLKMSRATILQFAHDPVSPERATRQAMPGKLNSYLPYLEQRWQSGCTNSSQLWREIQEQGYSGKRIQVARWMRQQRTRPATTPPKKYLATNHIPQGSIAPVKEQNHLPAARQLAWLGVRANAKLTDEDRTLLDEIRQDEHFEQAFSTTLHRSDTAATCRSA